MESGSHLNFGPGINIEAIASTRTPMNSPPKILVIDDNTALLESLRRLLLDAGYDPEVATTGQAGLDLALRTNPDLILLDVVLPDGSGVEICRKLKTDPPPSRPLVALMSGLVTDSNQQAAGIEAGADEYISQPMGSRELRARVKALLRLKRAEDGLTQLNQELEKRVEQRTAQLELVNEVLLQEIAERKRAERARLESEGQYRWLFETMAQGVVYQEAGGHIISANPAAEHILGLTLSQMRERTSADPGWRAIGEAGAVFPGEDHPAMVALRTGQPVRDVVMGVFHPLEQRYRWIVVSSIPQFRKGESSPFQVYSTFTDVTELKQAERRARESQQAYERLIHTIDGTVWEGDPYNLRCTFISRQAESMLGYPVTQWLQDPDFWQNHLHPEDRIWAPAFCLRAAAQGKDYRIEYRMIAADGREVWLSDRVTIEASGGQPVSLRGISVDITERKQAEAALRKSEQYAKSIIECSRDMIITVDNERRIVEFNKAAQACFGYPREEIVGESVNRLYADQQESQTVHERTCQQGKLSQEILNRRKNGDLFPCFLSASALRNAQGELLGMVGVSRDVTEEKQAETERRNWEAKLQQIQKLESLGVMAGGIAHDFNNLLTAILGHADLALADLPPDSPVRGGLHEIKLASLRAAAICQQMLACSGKGRFTVQPTDLSGLVREITQLVKASISKKVSVRYHLAENVPVIEADPAQVNQLVINLVINASESIADQEGIIDISTGTLQCDANYLKQSHFIDFPPEGTYVFLEIGDTGCGMDPETQARIFDPFFTTKFMGRGLGLAAALGIVRAHKGAIRVESRSGQGTVFRVLFPVSKNATQRLMGTPVTSDAWRGSGTILLVDDEEPVRHVCKPILERYGFLVLTAADGREAVRLFQEHHASIVCVLLDLTMPRLGGADTYRELRRLQSDVRVILASGYSESEITQRFADLGFAGFIQKPYQMATLIAKLRGTLERGESKR